MKKLVSKIVLTSMVLLSAFNVSAASHTHSWTLIDGKSTPGSESTHSFVYEGEYRNCIVVTHHIREIYECKTCGSQRTENTTSVYHVNPLCSSH